MMSSANHERLDRMIATKLMGIRLKKKKMKYGRPPQMGYQLQYPGGKGLGNANGFYGWGWHDKEESAWFYCPHYSTDIGAAWEVWTLIAKNSVSVFNQFLTEICMLAHTAVIPAALQRLSPEIICKAALKVKGVSLKKLAV